jgi:4a-hydroxytetrahydrobiopterin dehydratase
MTMATKSVLTSKKCVPCEGGVPALDLAAATRLKAELRDEWKLVDGGKKLEASFEFQNYYRTTAFINGAIWIAHHEDHHPDIRFGYNHCTIQYWTHTIDGLSENDFICAAKIDALLA